MKRVLPQMVLPLSNKVLEGELDFSNSRKVGPKSAVIGKKGQILHRLYFQSNEGCCIKVYTKEKRSLSKEILDRLAGRDKGALLGDYTLNFYDATYVDLHYKLPIEITVIGGKGKLRYYAHIEEKEAERE